MCILNSYKTHFNICTFNLFNYIAPPDAFYEIDNIYSLSQWDKKERWIRQQLLELAPDIVGFQEVFSPKSLSELTKKAGLPYFLTVSDAVARSEHIYEKPVVALASRFPIESVRTVKVSASVIKDLKLKNGFSFSRPPIKAVLNIDGFSRVLVYVLHLKSKRSQLEPSRVHQDSNQQGGNGERIADSLLAEIHGSWASSIQRGTEAALIYHDIVQEMMIKECPVIVMGDLNDTIDSAALLPLIGSHKLDKLDGKFIKDLPLADQRAMDRFILHDAFDLQGGGARDNQRKSTHYFMNQGSVLDYILLSKDFNSNYDHSLASVTSYRVNDKHLINPHHINDAECSDHAPVAVEIEIRL